ncbi:hypothetical protein [Pedobacter sp. L105]|uniref:hypothetical protein n=1 Tax=Pedobacter sp. L105 TaxID=1641871 RepID=UPI00131E9FC3|nr:hypothetical protein [Pedobacter sp. L105]
MKTIFGIFITALCCFSVKGQQANLSNTVTLILPSGAVKIMPRIRTNGTEEYRSSAKAMAKRKNYYNINGMTLGFWDLGIVDSSVKTLEQKKEEAIAIAKIGGFINANAIIQTFNHIQFIILSYHQNEWSFYRFSSEYHNDKMINGIIQFKPEDKNRAADLLSRFLNSMEFKN